MLKKILIAFFSLLILLNVILYITDNLHLYKTVLYNYVDIDDNKLFSQRPIPAGAGKPWPLSDAYNKIEIPSTTLEELERMKSVAFLIVKNDSILYERYWENYESSSISNSFSMAKSIVSILIGIAIDEGYIKDLDQRAGDFLEAFNNSEYDDLTIRNLLMMSSGLNWDEAYGSMFSMTTKAYYGSDLRKLANEMRMTDTPGIRFRYQSGNTLLLGMILEKATGQTLSTYASEKLWKPIDAEHPAEWSLDAANGFEKSYCCFYSNARDFARIGQLYLDSGRYMGVQIVSESYVLESIRPANILNEKGEKNVKYGLHWWLFNRKGYDIFYARGILGQYIAVIPALDLVMVRLGHLRGDKRDDGHVSDFVAYIDGLLQVFQE